MTTKLEHFQSALTHMGGAMINLQKAAFGLTSSDCLAAANECEKIAVAVEMLATHFEKYLRPHVEVLDLAPSSEANDCSTSTKAEMKAKLRLVPKLE